MKGRANTCGGCCFPRIAKRHMQPRYSWQKNSHAATVFVAKQLVALRYEENSGGVNSGELRCSQCGRGGGEMMSKFRHMCDCCLHMSSGQSCPHHRRNECFIGKSHRDPKAQ